MYCKYCKSEIPDNAIYCSNCGKKLIGVDNTQLDLLETFDTEDNLSILFSFHISRVSLNFSNGRWGKVCLRDEIGKEICLDKLCPSIDFATNERWINLTITLLDYDKTSDYDLFKKFESDKIEILKDKILRKRENEIRKFNAGEEDLEKDIEKIAREQNLSKEEIEELMEDVKEGKDEIIDNYLENLDEDGNYKPKRILKRIEVGTLFKKSYSFADKFIQTEIVVCKPLALYYGGDAISFGKLLKDFIGRKIRLCFSVEANNSEDEDSYHWNVMM